MKKSNFLIFFEMVQNMKKIKFGSFPCKVLLVIGKSTRKMIFLKMMKKQCAL